MAQLPTSPNNLDDSQSAQALKQYGGYIVAVIVLVLGSYFGWNYWQSHRAKVDTTAADLYADIQTLNDQVSLAAQNPDLDDAGKKALADNQAKLSSDIEKLTQAHGDTIYAWQALMLQARHQADAGDFDKANQSLKQALDLNLYDAGLKALTELRYGQNLLASGEADQALSMVNTEMPLAFEASKQELLGDIYLAKNDKEAAIRAYQNAWEFLKNRHEKRSILALKMESLGLTLDPIEDNQSLIVSNTPASASQNSVAQIAMSENNVDQVAVHADVGANADEQILQQADKQNADQAPKSDPKSE